MEVIIAEHAGFCFGAKRAVDLVCMEAEKEGALYTFGPIVHNETVVKGLEEKGVKVINDISELDHIKNSTILIRAHGVTKEVEEAINSSGNTIIDATCPFVKRIHKIVEAESQNGAHIIVIGNASHPEVEGIVSRAFYAVDVVETEEEALSFSCEENKKLYIVSQTTFNYNKFQELVEIFRKKGYHISVANTICNATEERQSEACRIAKKVDAMIVIGGTNSSNTRKLFEICSKECNNTFFIQTLDDLQLELPNSVSLVGITAGASTPSNIIEEVQNYVRINF